MLKRVKVAIKKECFGFAKYAWLGKGGTFKRRKSIGWGGGIGLEHGGGEKGMH